MFAIKFLIIIFLIGFAVSCRQTVTEPVSEAERGSIVITSEPSGAMIFLDELNTEKITPDSLIFLQPGLYSIKLRFFNFRDTSFFVNVFEGQRSIINIKLRN